MELRVINLANLRAGILEGVESATDSPGLGKNPVFLLALPEVGHPFMCLMWPQGFFHTSRVREVQPPDAAGDITFYTTNTKYVLSVRVEPGLDEPPVPEEVLN